MRHWRARLGRPWNTPAAAAARKAARRIRKGERVELTKLTKLTSFAEGDRSGGWALWRVLLVGVWQRHTGLRQWHQGVGQQLVLEAALAREFGPDLLLSLHEEGAQVNLLIPVRPAADACRLGKLGDTHRHADLGGCRDARCAHGCTGGRARRRLDGARHDRERR